MTCEKHAGSDKSFENITLCLAQLFNSQGKENTENPGSESGSEHATSM